MSQALYYAGEVALWLQRECGQELEFLGCHNLTGVTVPRGDLNPSYCRTGKNKFEVVRTWRGMPGLGTATIVAYDTVLNLIQELESAFNLYVLHAAGGADEDPTNYDYLYIYEDVEPSAEAMETHAIGMSPDAQTHILGSYPVSFQDRTKVKKLTGVARDISALTAEDINGVAFCDGAFAGNIAEGATQSCQTGFLVGDAGILLRTLDGGGTFTAIMSPFTDVTDPIGAVYCEGDLVVITNAEDTAYAYSWDGGDTWTEVLTPTKLINRVFMLGGTKMWMVGQDGYVYFSNNRGASVAVQDYGSATSSSLNDVAFASGLLGYAVGDDNAFIRTVDGGSIWAAVTGPAAGLFPNDLYRVAVVPGTDIVFVGDEQGNLYRSDDQGDTWTTVLDIDAMAGGIAGIAICNCNVISVVGNDEDPYFYSGASVDGVMYQTVDGGNSWQAVEIPANDGVNDIICCDPNQYWIVGEDGYVAYVAGPTA